MNRWQKVFSAVLLAGALLAGLGIYLATRPPTVPDGFVLEDLDGQARSLAEFRGRPLLVNFWATWCPPCRREIPLLKTLQSENQGLTVVGIAVEEAEPVRQLAAEMAFNYPILIGEQTAIDLAVALGIEFIGLPYTVLIDARGRVIEVHTGELREEDARHAIEVLLP